MSVAVTGSKLLVAAFILVLWGLDFAIPTAQAQGLSVAPTTVEFLPRQLAASLIVTNKSSEVTTMQVRVVAWTQNAAGDQLAPTAALSVSPPIFDVPGGSAQLVRLILRVPPNTKEDSYRLLINQLPVAGEPGMHLALAFSVPVFAKARAEGGADLEFHIAPSGDRLVAINHGARRERMLRPMLIWPSGKMAMNTGRNYYVLAGSEQEWPLPSQMPALHKGEKVKIRAASLAGILDKPVSVSDP